MPINKSVIWNNKSMYDIDLDRDFETEVKKLQSEQWNVYDELETLRKIFYNSGTAKDGHIQSQQMDKLETRLDDLERKIIQLKRQQRSTENTFPRPGALYESDQTTPFFD